MSITRYRRTLLTGGSSAAVDGIDGSLLNDGDICEFYSVNDTFDTYRLDADSGAAENSPWVIVPDTNPGSKRWLLVNPVSLVDSNLGKSYGVNSIGGGKEFIRLAFDSGIRGLDRNGTNHSMLRIANVSGIDAGVYNFMLLGSSTLGWVSCPVMLDLVANNIVDVANVGNIANESCNTRLVQQYPADDLIVAISTIDDEGNLIDRLAFENYADTTLTYFMFTKVGIGTQVPTAGYLTLGGETLEFSPALGVRTQLNGIEFGHPSTGYGSTIGAESSSGAPFIAFNCGAGTNADKYKTTGQLGAIIKHAGGYLSISRITNNSADNQTPANTMTLDPSGYVGIGTASPSAKLHVVGGIRIGQTGSSNGPIEISDRNSTAAQSINMNVYFDDISAWKYRNSDYGGRLAFDSSGNWYFQTMPSGTAGNEAVLNDTTRIMILNGGSVGIGLIDPSACLHIKAGTTTAGTAPLKLTSGSLNTSPEAGAIEFDGTHLYFVDSTNTRRQLAVV